MNERPSALARLDRPALLLGLCLAAYLPFALLGYGSDIDVANVLRSGREWLDDGVYRVSRTPGAAVHEVPTAVLDRIGGYVVVNLASVFFGVVTLAGVHDLLRRAGSAQAPLAVLVLAANPWFWMASTSLGDFVWSIGLLVAGAVAARRGHRASAGLLFGLAIGCRMSAAVLVLAWLLAERLGVPTARWRATLVTVAVTALAGAACFVPSWLWADRTFDFLDSGLGFDGVTSHVGRWGIKNLAFFGVLAVPVLLAGLPRLVRSAGAWRTSVAFRFGVLALLATEALFLLYPLKPLHLVPAAVALAVIVGHVGPGGQRWLVLLIAAQLVGAVVTTTIAAPDVEDRADSGQIDLGLTAGPLLNDVRCRLDDLDAGGYDEDRDQESMARSAANFDCQLETWRADDD